MNNNNKEKQPSDDDIKQQNKKHKENSSNKNVSNKRPKASKNINTIQDQFFIPENGVEFILPSSGNDKIVTAKVSAPKGKNQ